ncbi:diguanylate cyclase regulator RdcB family protein [Acinetobacter radioresistens]|uniref:diguanylate cyclase regulator RdcB family protein n=1 Tax=Acinetobacter radioresistens TaxID=40216 RepID=UPI0034D4CD2B
MTTLDKLLVEETYPEFKFLNEKLIVDFINGITVSKDLQSKIKKRSSHKNRFFDAISGKSYLRQAHLNDHVLTGLSACEGWLNLVSNNLNEHSVAISQISHSLSKTQAHLTHMAGVMIDVRDQVHSLLKFTDNLVQDVQVLKTTDAAKTHLDIVFSSWEVGDLDDYSIISKSYIALDNLYWGSFSKVVHFPNKSNYLKLLRNKLVIQLKKEFGASSDDQLYLRSDWILNEQKNQNTSELLEYLGDWSLKKPNIVPNVFLATQWDTLDNTELEKPEIEHLPFHVADINTVADSLIKEFFEVRKNV